MKTKIANRSKAQGFPRSRLPEFTIEEKALLKGTYDYVAVNSYSSDLAESMTNPNMTTDWDHDAEVHVFLNDSMKVDIHVHSSYPGQNRTKKQILKCHSL